MYDRTMRLLQCLILKDLSNLGIDCTSFELLLKPYSKTYLGRYFTLKKRVVVYVYKDKERTTVFNYKDLIDTTIHEVCHHLQWSDPEYTRVKGVMHNNEFWKLYNSYISRLEKSRERLYLKPLRRVFNAVIYKKNRGIYS